MTLSRRLLLASPLLLPTAARAAADDPRLAPRAAGNPSAPAHVQEWFSLTCTHCARFDQEVFPEVKAKLIDTGKVYYLFKDFPLDRIALMAAMVARALPPERYLPFVDSLFASQDRWAFAEGVDTKAVLQQMAALAGMSEATFTATVNDADYQKAIIAEQDTGQKRYQINSTPTFVFGSTPMPGELTYQMFADRISHLVG
jgi:protein-disulfide isomerase